jgi:DNA-binding protein H-NS
METPDAQHEEENAMALPDVEELPESELFTFMEGALDRLSVESLSRMEQAVRERRQAKQDEARVTAREKIEEQLKSSGLSLFDLYPELAKTRSKGGSGSVPTKYRGPNDESWSGRGHKPNWLTKLIEEGRQEEEFLIRKESA